MPAEGNAYTQKHATAAGASQHSILYHFISPPPPPLCPCLLSSPLLSLLLPLPSVSPCFRLFHPCPASPCFLPLSPFFSSTHLCLSTSPSEPFVSCPSPTSYREKESILDPHHLFQWCVCVGGGGLISQRSNENVFERN